MESSPILSRCKIILSLNVFESCEIFTPIFFYLDFHEDPNHYKGFLQCSRGTANQLKIRFRPQGSLREEITETKMSALVFFYFLLCGFPFSIFHIATIDKVNLVGVITFVTIFASFSSVINPSICAGMNTKIRRAICL